MSSALFTLMVSYSQVVVYLSSLADPFNFWTKRHSDQGFAWRPGCVSFATLEWGGLHEVEVVTTAHEGPLPELAQRIIQTPFDVPITESIIVASVSDKRELSVAPGQYNLRFECLASIAGYSGRIRLVFTESRAPSFAVLRADPGLTLKGELLIGAEPP